MAMEIARSEVEDDEICGPLPIGKLEVSLLQCLSKRDLFHVSSELISFQQHGVSASDIRKLEDHGYHSVESLAYATKKQLVAVKGISETKADKIAVSINTYNLNEFCSMLILYDRCLLLLES